MAAATDAVAFECLESTEDLGRRPGFVKTRDVHSARRDGQLGEWSTGALVPAAVPHKAACNDDPLGNLAEGDLGVAPRWYGS